MIETFKLTLSRNVPFSLFVGILIESMMKTYYGENVCFRISRMVLIIPKSEDGWNVIVDNLSP